jgi:hypothetical protein
MPTKTTLAMVLFIVAAILGAVAACVPTARGALLPLAVAVTALGLAVQAS